MRTAKRQPAPKREKSNTLEEQREREAIDRAISAYYDNLTNEAGELRAWGEYSTALLRRTSKSGSHAPASDIRAKPASPPIQPRG